MSEELTIQQARAYLRNLYGKGTDRSLLDRAFEDIDADGACEDDLDAKLFASVYLIENSVKGAHSN